MRYIERIIIHCSATAPSHDVDVRDITRWHVQGNGWSDCGYHYFIKRDGTIEDGRPITRPGAHTKGYNQTSIGGCYAGGVDEKGNPEDNRTEAQEASLIRLIHALLDEFPEINDIAGHNEFSSKACPSFDVKKWWNGC